MSNIRYFIPEDGDTEANPNVFLAPKPSRPGYPPTLEQIKSSFPLPGRYHFRFKTTLIPGVDKGPAVWMDCVDDTQPVAVYKNSIIAKVTRISLEDSEDDDSFRAAAVHDVTSSFPTNSSNIASAAATPRESYTTTANTTPSILPKPPQRPSPPDQQQQQPSSANMADDARLINMFDEPSSHRSSSFPPSSNSSYGDLLDGIGGDADDPLLNMSHSGTDDHDFFGGVTTTVASSFPSSSAHDELLNMSAPAVATTSNTPLVQTSSQQQHHHHHHASVRQQQGYSNNNKVQQMNGSFVSLNIGGAGLQQQQGMNQRNGTMMNIPQQSNKPSSAPSSGNRLKSNNTPNVFDSFQDKQSPFADLGRLI